MVSPDLAVLREAARPLTGAASDHDRLLDDLAGARIVLLGEASHGTHEFYAERARITRRLIAERGFDAVAVEADWPDAYRVACYARGQSDDASADAALADFVRFPRWMWRNEVVAGFADWLRGHNARQGTDVGFYGLDLYSLTASVAAVLRHLDAVDPEAAARARERYACFEHLGGDGQSYGYRVTAGTVEPCEDEVVAQLVELQQRAADAPVAGDRDAAFVAATNARLVRNAEAYYREMFWGSVRSWNLRDSHMADTLAALDEHLGGDARIVVWAHNSHVGDARATAMGRQGEHNLGQLVRERWGVPATAIVGFTTHTGTVAAASAWDGPVERKHVRPSLAGSYESVLHSLGVGDYSLPLHDPGLADVLRAPRLERMIGVIYRPESERASHYVECRLPEQFDHVVHLDETHAVQPLDERSGWSGWEAPRTYPHAV